jgi:hypothetical protein
MNRNVALAIVLAATFAGNAFAGNAFADDITIDTTPFTSTLSRAEVQSDLAQFQSAGNSPWQDDYRQVAQFQGAHSRAQVEAGYIAAREQVAAMGCEDSGSSYMMGRVGRPDDGVQVASE